MTDVGKLKAGRDLDRLIAEKVMGRKTEILATSGNWLRFTPEGITVPFYSTDIAAAWLVVERILAIEKAKETYLPVFSVQTSPTGSSAVLQVGMGCKVAAENASTAPLAICLTALKVLEVRRWA